MIQVRIHGRGGQGVVTAAEMLSVAAFDEGRYAQAFPSFGSERMGAPVVAFCRIDDREIRTREPIVEPDALIIQDPTLLHQVDLFAGLLPDGYILINSARSFDELGLGEFGGSLPPGADADRAGDRARAASTSAGPCPTRCCSAALPRSPGSSPWMSLAAALRTRFPGAQADAQRRRRPRGPCLGDGRDAGARPCADRLRARAPSPRRWRLSP